MGCNSSSTEVATSRSSGTALRADAGHAAPMRKLAPIPRSAPTLSPSPNPRPAPPPLPSSDLISDLGAVGGGDALRSQEARGQVRCCLRDHAAPAIADPLAAICVAYMRRETDVCSQDRDAVAADGAPARVCVCDERCASCPRVRQCLARTDVDLDVAAPGGPTAAAVSDTSWSSADSDLRICCVCFVMLRAEQTKRNAAENERRVVAYAALMAHREVEREAARRDAIEHERAAQWYRERQEMEKIKKAAVDEYKRAHPRRHHHHHKHEADLFDMVPTFVFGAPTSSLAHNHCHDGRH